MAFGAFETLAEVLRAYQIQLREARFVQPRPVPVDERFRARLDLLGAKLPVSASEQSISEFLITPVLQEIWPPYSDALTIWSHVQFGSDETLVGYPDYFIARQSPLGPIVQERPYVMFVEAKKDDFDGGWGQCLAAMLAGQKLNDEPEGVIYGGVSNGRVWYLGKLEGRVLTQDPRAFTLGDLEGLFAALNYVFSEAKARVLASIEAEAKG